MKKSIIIFAMLFLSTYTLSNVKRIDQDMYVSNGIYIETQYCYHYTYGENATLKWTGKYGNNKIYWQDNTSCDVKDVWKK